MAAAGGSGCGGPRGIDEEGATEWSRWPWWRLIEGAADRPRCPWTVKGAAGAWWGPSVASVGGGGGVPAVVGA